MKFSLLNNTAEIPKLTEEIELFLEQHQVPPAIAMSTSLCLDELLTNTISYGYESSRDAHQIQVNVDIVDNTMTIEISDDAKPFDPTKETPPPDLDADLEDRRIGGLGVHLVKHYSDEIQYAHQDGKNHLKLIKHLA